VKAVCVIPSRYESTRFPGKALAMVAGRTLIERVYSRVMKARHLKAVCVATDDERIYNEVIRFGGKAIMTSTDHQSGTDRIAEAVMGIDGDLIVNVQGDEPLIPPRLIDDLIGLFEYDDSIMAATAAHVITSPDQIDSPNSVKVIIDHNSDALYYSRSAIPAVVDYGDIPDAGISGWPGYLKHIGIYAFTRDTLLEFARMEPTPLEKLERLEQLRLIESGIKTRVLITDYQPVAVDIPDDINKVVEILNERA
jgi:3-deoxy-manno-octulosonate cytidylyltransferase (CMP-KDO synthetase)